VKQGGEEEKFVMLKTKTRPALRDAAFAQDDALGATAKRLANQGPFFKTDAHGEKDDTARMGMKQFRRSCADPDGVPLLRGSNAMTSSGKNPILPGLCGAIPNGTVIRILGMERNPFFFPFRVSPASFPTCLTTSTSTAIRGFPAMA
jgi:hypothetical protein